MSIFYCIGRTTGAHYWIGCAIAPERFTLLVDTECVWLVPGTFDPAD